MENLGTIDELKEAVTRLPRTEEAMKALYLHGKNIIDNNHIATMALERANAKKTSSPLEIANAITMVKAGQELVDAILETLKEYQA
jgi:hypothetical protein